MPTRRHRVIQYAIVNGQRDHLNVSLTDGRAAIRSALRYADIFHSYETTDLDGAPLRVAYARFLPGSPKHGFSKLDPRLDITYVFVTTASAADAGFGLAERNDVSAAP